LFYLLLLRLTPRSTLFPYTTLFRSEFGALPGERPELVGGERECGRVAGDRVAHEQERRHVEPVHHVPGDQRDMDGFVDGDLHHQDRKSTRLNSSHVSISYAVFCLKK